MIALEEPLPSAALRLSNAHNTMGKILSFEQVRAEVEALRKEGKTIVATNGCFDLLHVGHVRNLEEAKALGNVLVVGINSDESVRQGKGDTRPIVPDSERAEMLAALTAVDYVFIYSERTPFSWITELRPNIHTKGGGEDIRSHPDLQAQIDVVEGTGGTLVLTEHHEGKSTSNLIKKILSSSKE